MFFVIQESPVVVSWRSFSVYRYFFVFNSPFLRTQELLICGYIKLLALRKYELSENEYNILGFFQTFVDWDWLLFCSDFQLLPQLP